MGRIKSLMVKRAAKQLMVKQEGRFTELFGENKKILGKETMPSKPIRNKVAGYLARLVKMKRIESTKPKETIKIEEMDDIQYQ